MIIIRRIFHVTFYLIESIVTCSYSSYSKKSAKNWTACDEILAIDKEQVSPRALCGHAEIPDSLKIEFGLSGKYEPKLQQLNS